MKIFIVHYKKLIERKKYLITALSNLDYQFIDQYDRDSMLEYDTLYKENNIGVWNERVKGIYNEEPVFRELKNSEICNSLSHLDAMKNIVEQKLEYGIILEDDVILNFDFKNKIDEIINNIPKDFDFIFFGTSFSMKLLDDITSDESINVVNNIWKKKYGITRTVDAYMVSNNAAKKIVDNISEIVLPFDFELTYFFRKLKMNIYWYDPGFVNQGSMTGNYVSSIR